VRRREDQNMNDAVLRYGSIQGQAPGLLASLLARNYQALILSEPGRWLPEQRGWEAFDAEAFRNPDTVGACVFLSWCGEELVGFGSYDPRQAPQLGHIGHNCILPEFRGRGFGRQQIQEILRRFRGQGIRLARATTQTHPFFAPARRMYVACGFNETGRRAWELYPQQEVIEYERGIGS